MTAGLRSQGDHGKRKRVAWRLPALGVETIYPTPRMSPPPPTPLVYLY
jgi:hypothetical protein